jgi:hypothetical protein
MSAIPGLSHRARTRVIDPPPVSGRFGAASVHRGDAALMDLALIGGSRAIRALLSTGRLLGLSTGRLQTLQTVEHTTKVIASRLTCYTMRSRRLNDRHGVSANVSTTTKRVPTLIHLDVEQREQLKAAGRANERTMSAELRYVIARYYALEQSQAA